MEKKWAWTDLTGMIQLFCVFTTTLTSCTQNQNTSVPVHSQIPFNQLNLMLSTRCLLHLSNFHFVMSVKKNEYTCWIWKTNRKIDKRNKEWFLVDKMPHPNVITIWFLLWLFWLQLLILLSLEWNFIQFDILTQLKFDFDSILFSLFVSLFKINCNSINANNVQTIVSCSDYQQIKFIIYCTQKSSI